MNYQDLKLGETLKLDYDFKHRGTVCKLISLGEKTVGKKTFKTITVKFNRSGDEMTYSENHLVNFKRLM